MIAVFEKRPDEYLTTAPGADELGKLVEAGSLKMLYLRPLDLARTVVPRRLSGVALPHGRCARPHGISFLTDGIVLQRYIEIDGKLRKAMVVAKMRGFDHSKELRLCDFAANGIVIGDALADYEGILVGKPSRTRGE